MLMVKAVESAYHKEQRPLRWKRWCTAISDALHSPWEETPNKPVSLFRQVLVGTKGVAGDGRSAFQV